MQRNKLTVGTRDSDLARFQTDQVVAKLKSINPTLDLHIKHITTGGDKVRDRPIAEIGGRGVFVKELEEALLNKSVDFVVHSLKDLPTDMPEGLTLAAVLNREDPRDVFLSNIAKSFADLKTGSTVATSSRRRAAQLLAWRQDLKFVDIRGNVPTRVRKMDEGQCDAIILAAAGLHRLEMSNKIKEYLHADKVTPAAGQGVLAVECRSKDKDIIGLLEGIEDTATRFEITAERSFLDKLGSGCSVPAGALARFRAGDGTLTISGCVAALDGSQMLRATREGPAEQAEELGSALAQTLIAMGAEDILKELRQSTPNVVSPP